MSTYAAFRRATLVETAFPKSFATSVLTVLGGAAVTAGLAQISINLPFTPVPITLQTMGALLAGSALGARKGLLSQLVYALAGLVGLPVFASGAGGASHIFGATGGYILGFIAAGYLAGLLAERGWDRSGRVILGMALADAVIFLFGLAWLIPFVGIGQVVALGLLPFIPGEVVKIAGASGALPLAWKVTRKV